MADDPLWPGYQDKSKKSKKIRPINSTPKELVVANPNVKSKRPRVVIVTGGRHYKNRKKVFEVLDLLSPDLVVHGACPTGADYYAKKWCMTRGVSQRSFKAKWDELGPKAGPIRNQEMFSTNPMAVLAFPGGHGTTSCCNIAKKQGVAILRVE